MGLAESAPLKLATQQKGSNDEDRDQEEEGEAEVCSAENTSD